MSLHNLDINSYSLDELFALFDLTYDLTDESMRAAKKKVLMLHPDKSKLPSTYFLFYKKAYEIVLDIYKTKNRVELAKNTPASALVYNPDIDYGASGVGSRNNVSAPDISSMNVDARDSKFGEKFNEIYEKNMAKKIDSSKYDWFRQESVDEFAGKNITVSNMGNALETIKQKQQALAVYKGVQAIRPIGIGANFYENDDDEDENGQTSYIECDVFSKLKFDDLRKVHRDQPVIGVSERAYDKMPKYSSVEQYANARNANMGAPLSKLESESLLEKQQREHTHAMMRKQQRDLIIQREWEEKQKLARAAFMRIGN